VASAEAAGPDASSRAVVRCGGTISDVPSVTVIAEPPTVYLTR
jgi:hypothetical protein